MLLRLVPRYNRRRGSGMKKLWLWGAPFVLVMACGGESDDFGPGPTGGSSGSAGSSGASGGSSGSAGKPSGGIALEDTPHAYATAYCSLLERCEGIFYELITAYEDCVTVTEQRLRQ